jgi:hypothetical protein
MKIIKENIVTIIVGVVLGVIICFVISIFPPPDKAFQYSHFMVGKIEIESEHFCKYSLGREINKKFKRDFDLIDRCGMYNVKDNLLLIKGLPDTTQLKKGK